jgi:hypothetical protein
MKKLLLISTAIVGVAMMSAPAQAELKLDLGGFFRGYGVYADNNEVAGAATSLYKFEFRRDVEVHFKGETTLDNGLTIGAYAEQKIANGSTAVTGDEVYAYASGGWGRFNLGVEDAAGYLLQVSAPSADSNIDGMRVNIAALNPTVTQGTAGLATAVGTSGLLATTDYEHADFSKVDRLTFLTPKFNGFQGGISYAPKDGVTSNNAGMALDENGLGTVVGGVGTATAYKNLWEASARYDGEFQGFGFSFGGVYSDSSNEVDPTTAQYAAQATDEDYFINDGVKTWSLGTSVSFSGFSLGGGYKVGETSRTAQTIIATDLAANIFSGDVTNKTWNVGAGWDNGPYHAGASYLHSNIDLDAVGLAANAATGSIAASSYTTSKAAVGGGYTFGPGMTFRGAVAWGKFNAPGTGAANDNRFTQVTLGTDIQF